MLSSVTSTTCNWYRGGGGGGGGGVGVGEGEGWWCSGEEGISEWLRFTLSSA